MTCSGDDDGPKCASCNKPFSGHLGIQGTCAENIKLRDAVRGMMSAAGNPDAAVGCRLVIEIGKEVLEEG